MSGSAGVAGTGARVRLETLLLILAVSLLWGASYLFIKVALDDMGPGAITFFRVALGAAVALPLAARAGALAGLRPYLRHLAVIGVVQLCLPMAGIALGERWVTSSVAGLLTGAVPIYIALLALLVDHGERATGVRLAGIALGFAGVAAVVGLDVGGGSRVVLGSVIVLLAVLGYAVGPLYAKRHLGGLPPLGIVAVGLAFSTLACLPLLLVDLPSRAPGWDTVGALVTLGVGGTGLAFIAYYRVMQAIGPGRASVIAYLVTGFAVVYGVTFADDPIGLGTVLGLVGIGAGSWLGARR